MHLRCDLMHSVSSTGIQMQDVPILANGWKGIRSPA